MTSDITESDAQTTTDHHPVEGKSSVRLEKIC